MKWTYYLALFSLAACLSGCAGMGTGVDINSGRQAMFVGNNQAALSYFETAAQTDPNYINGTDLREGVWSYVGRAQYLTGNLAQARQTLEKSLSLHPSDNVARLYLGLTLARLGDRKAGLQDIQAGMTGIYNFINYITETFRYTWGRYWDQGRAIRNAIEQARAMISTENFDWGQLIAAGERIGILIEEEPDKVLQAQETQMEMRGP